MDQPAAHRRLLRVPSPHLHQIYWATLQDSFGIWHYPAWPSEVHFVTQEVCGYRFPRRLRMRMYDLAPFHHRDRNCWTVARSWRVTSRGSQRRIDPGQAPCFQPSTHGAGGSKKRRDHADLPFRRNFLVARPDGCLPQVFCLLRTCHASLSQTADVQGRTYESCAAGGAWHCSALRTKNRTVCERHETTFSGSEGDAEESIVP